MGPDMGMRSKEDSANGRMGATAVDRRLSGWWTALYYTVLLWGAVGFYKYLWVRESWEKWNVRIGGHRDLVFFIFADEFERRHCCSVLGAWCFGIVLCYVQAGLGIQWGDDKIIFNIPYFLILFSSSFLLPNLSVSIIRLGYWYGD